MSWEDRLQKASFKGSTFYVEANSKTLGRRVPVRRLAGMDGSRQQDLGRDPDEFTIEAFFWGDDYDKTRDGFEAILTQSGPGSLVLPTRGDLWARVTGPIQVNERRDERGFCTLRFSVVVEDRKAGNTVKSRPDTSAKLKSTAFVLRGASKSDFDDSYTAKGIPSKYLQGPAKAIGAVTDKLREVNRTVQGVLNVNDSIAGALTDLDSQVNTLVSSPSQLVSGLINVTLSALSISDTVKAGIDRTTGLPSLIKSTFEQAASARATQFTMRALSALSQPVSTTGTPLVLQSQANVRAIYRCVRATALSRACETLASAPLDSSTLALSVLTTINAEIDALAVMGASDALVEALLDLRGAASQHLTTTATKLPQTTNYHVPGASLPAVVVAYILFRDAEQEFDILLRNQPAHPLFLSGDVEVLQS